MADGISSIAGSALPGLAGASGMGLGGLGLEAVGMGVSAVAGFEESGYEKDIANASGNIANLQQQSNVVKFAQSQLTARRGALQEIRNAQVSRSLALASANAGGAGPATGHASAFGGAVGQIAGQAGTNLLGINQNMRFGQQEFAINNQISAQQQRIAQDQGNIATWQGIGGIGSGATSLGGATIKSATNPSGSLF